MALYKDETTFEFTFVTHGRSPLDENIPNEKKLAHVKEAIENGMNQLMPFEPKYDWVKDVRVVKSSFEQVAEFEEGA